MGHIFKGIKQCKLYGHFEGFPLVVEDHDMMKPTNPNTDALGFEKKFPETKKIFHRISINLDTLPETNIALENG